MDRESTSGTLTAQRAALGMDFPSPTGVDGPIPAHIPGHAKRTHGPRRGLANTHLELPLPPPPPPPPIDDAYTYLSAHLTATLSRPPPPPPMFVEDDGVVAALDLPPPPPPPLDMSD